MTRLFVCSSALVACSALSCGQSLPPVDTPQTLPPAEPRADVTRAPRTQGADAGELEEQSDAQPSR